MPVILCVWLCICLLLVYVYIIASDCRLVFVYEHMLCICARVRMPRPIWAPCFLSAPSGPAAAREWVSHPADERVKVKALPSQKNITQLPRSLFEVIQEEGGKRHTFSIALKHGVRQLPSCGTLYSRLHFGLKWSFKWDTVILGCVFWVKFPNSTQNHPTSRSWSKERWKHKSIRSEVPPRQETQKTEFHHFI